jgi:hypothetical protein
MRHMLGLWALFWIGGPKRRNKMGVENYEMAIVNSQLSVRGVEKLSAVDASVMSSIQSANINAAMIMLAEKPAISCLARHLWCLRHWIFSIVGMWMVTCRY